MHPIAVSSSDLIATTVISTTENKLRTAAGATVSPALRMVGLKKVSVYTRSSISKLVAQLRQHENLTVRVRELLPAQLAAHLFMAQLQDTRLILLVDSSVWASQLRFMAPRLVRKEFPGVLSVRVAVYVERQPEQPPPQTKTLVRRLSAKNAEQLRTLAADIADPGLKTALLRLAARGFKTDG